MRRVMLIDNKKGLVFTYLGARFNMCYDLREKLDRITEGVNISDKAYYNMYCNFHKMVYDEECYIFISDGMVIIKLKEGSERFIIRWNENFIAEIREYEEE